MWILLQYKSSKLYTLQLCKLQDCNQQGSSWCQILILYHLKCFFDMVLLISSMLPTSCPAFLHLAILAYNQASASHESVFCLSLCLCVLFFSFSFLFQTFSLMWYMYPFQLTLDVYQQFSFSSNMYIHHCFLFQHESRLFITHFP